MDRGEPNSSAMSAVSSDPEMFGSDTTKLLRRIIRKVEADMKLSSSIPMEQAVPRTVRYTGMHKDNVQMMLATGEPLQIKHIDIDRHMIHKELITMYLNKKCIPTITQLFNAVHHALPTYADIDYFKTILNKLGYVFYKYPGQKVLHVLEKKSVTFDRYKYLKSIQHYRVNNVPIVYIGMGSLHRSYELLNLEKTLRTPDLKAVPRILFTATVNTVNHLYLVHTFSFEVVKRWLINNVLNDLQQRSVIILEDSKIFNYTTIEVPTVTSVKIDMVEWLQEHNIPCNINMTKSSLIDLIETCTDTNENTCILDNIVKSYNHKLLRLPQCINGLSISELLLRFLNDNKKIKQHTYKAVKLSLTSVSKEQLEIFANCVEKEEQRLLEEDSKVDNDLDELIRNVKETITLDDEDSEDDSTVSTFSDSD